MRKGVLAALSWLVLLAAPFMGQIALDWHALTLSNSVDAQVFFEIRIPRVALAFLAGGVLSLGGLLFQSLFRNPMSTPYTLGTAGAATLFAAIAIVSGWSAFTPLFAFGGALLSIALLFLLNARLSSPDTATLLLTGIALSFFYAAALLLIYYIADMEQNFEIMRFAMGGLDIVGYTSLIWLTLAALVLLGVSLLTRRALRMLLASYDFALLHGVHAKRTAYLLLGAVSLAVGATVSLTGPIGFVGLIVPHLISRLYRRSADRLLLPTFFYGGVFLVLCDLIARANPLGAEIPVGVVTAFVGAPFLVYMLLKRQTP